MSNVRELNRGAVTPKACNDLETMATAVETAINACKNAGVPQGLIVAYLHGTALRETQCMLDGNPA